MVVVMCQCVAFYLSLTSRFNVTPLYLSPCLHITATVIYSREKKKEFSKEISNHSEEDKAAEMSWAGGAGWAAMWACSGMKVWLVPHPSTPTRFESVTPSDMYFKRPLEAEPSFMKAFTHSDSQISSRHSEAAVCGSLEYIKNKYTKA